MPFGSMVLFARALSTYLPPPVQPQHGVAYLVYESSSSGEECALRIRQYYALELPDFSVVLLLVGVMRPPG
jgi:hypothetical protein